MTALLEARRMAAGYGGRPTVHDVDLTVAPGEVVALLGANGAGKSTTLKTLAGVLAPLGGEVVWQGRATRAPLHRRARSGLGYVSEERSVFMQLTAAENLRVGDGTPLRALELFPELEYHLGRRAGLLSGGQQQMLSLARALAAEPLALLADELSLGLAPIVVRRLLRAVRGAADGGMGVLLVEQHAHQALGIADRVYVMRQGRIALEASAAELRGRLDELRDTYLGGPSSDDPLATGRRSVSRR